MIYLSFHNPSTWASFSPTDTTGKYHRQSCCSVESASGQPPPVYTRREMGFPVTSRAFSCSENKPCINFNYFSCLLMIWKRSFNKPGTFS